MKNTIAGIGETSPWLRKLAGGALGLLLAQHAANGGQAPVYLGSPVTADAGTVLMPDFDKIP